MLADPILFQKKYSRIIECFAKKQSISFDEALSIFLPFSDISVDPGWSIRHALYEWWVFGGRIRTGIFWYKVGRIKEVPIWVESTVKITYAN